MPTLLDLADRITIAYLIIHGAICWLSDVQIILPDILGQPAYRAIYGPLATVVDDWAKHQGDFLVERKPLWFKSCVYAEMFLQFPLICWLVPQWLRHDNQTRTLSVVYASHVAGLSSCPAAQVLSSCAAGQVPQVHGLEPD